MKAGALIVAAGVVMWLMVLGALPFDLPGGFLGDRGGASADTPDAAAGATPQPASGTPAPAIQEEATATPTVEDDEPAGANGGAGGTVHTVVAGDTLARIAQQYNVSLQALINANPDLEDPSRLDIGQQISIP